jgi:glycosyltransferase involved in cell wall biosynthesis
MNETVLDTHAYPSDVIYQIDQEDAASYARAAEGINKASQGTIVIVQHEYGIYGGESGELLLGFLEAVRCPVIVTLHTVVANPGEKMRLVTERIIELCDKLVVLTDNTLELFNKLYPSSVSKTVRILHGIHPLLYADSTAVKPRFKLADRSVLLTFGLLSRNKGIEYIISALPKVRKTIPNIMYLIVGGTHPTVLRDEGESYRLELMKLVKDLGLQNYVRFMDDFLPLQDILGYLQATDVYVATSLDPEQAVSGTLSYALGTGRAVIATSFAQAKEVVSTKVGRVVPLRDSAAVATAAIELFSNRDALGLMNRAAYSQTRTMLWTNVADEYITLIANIPEPILHRWPALHTEHLLSMTDQFGMLQFSKANAPMRSSGYTLDDNSRALQFVYKAYSEHLLPEAIFIDLSRKYIQVLKTCLTHSPQVNYLSARTKLPTKQNFTEDLSDSLARAYYALQTIRYCDNDELRQIALSLLNYIPTVLQESPHLKTITQLLLGTVYALEAGDETMQPLVDKLSAILLDSYRMNRTGGWKWYQETMSYANGQMCSSILEVARVTGSDECKRVGIESLEFLSKTCFMGDVFAPIGQNGWHNKNGSRALFDQQPEDAFSMMQALESAHNLTPDTAYLHQVEKVFSWFMGNNLIGSRVYDDQTGGCHDGLTPRGVNANEGAESTLSFLGARLIMEQLGAKNRFQINDSSTNNRISAAVIQSNTLIL